jgi:hypothetical protein
MAAWISRPIKVHRDHHRALTDRPSWQRGAATLGWDGTLGTGTAWSRSAVMPGSTCPSRSTLVLPRQSPPVRSGRPRSACSRDRNVSNALPNRHEPPCSASGNVPFAHELAVPNSHALFWRPDCSYPRYGARSEGAAEEASDRDRCALRSRNRAIPSHDPERNKTVSHYNAPPPRPQR